jgi:hypothetical protein
MTEALTGCGEIWHRKMTQMMIAQEALTENNNKKTLHAVQQ